MRERGAERKMRRAGARSGRARQRDDRSSGGPFLSLRKVVWLTLLAVVSYVVFLAATAPARVIWRFTPQPPAIVNLSGTIWNGEVALQSGFVGAWSVDPLASLLSLGVDLDWRLTGPDTLLSGGALISLDNATLRAVEGAAGWPLVAALAPGLPIECDQRARLSLQSLVISEERLEADGVMTTTDGACTANDQTVPAPALDIVITSGAAGAEARIASRDDPETRLGLIELRNDARLVVTVEPAGARLVPGMPSSGATMVEIPLGFKFRAPRAHSGL